MFMSVTSTFKEVQPRVTRSGVSTTQQRSLCRRVCASSFVHEHLSAGDELCAIKVACWPMGSCGLLCRMLGVLTWRDSDTTFF